MPASSDIIKATLIYDCSGVTCRNDNYYRVTNVGTIPNLSAVAIGVQQAFEAATQAVLSTSTKYTACVVDNMTQNEVRGIATSQLAGTNIDGAHPQDQVLRFNEYGNNSPGLPLMRGAFNLSGTAEEYSDQGRLTTLTPFFPMISFLMDALVIVSEVFEMKPQVRTRIPGSAPPEYLHWDMQAVRINQRFFKLKSRKANLLGL